MVKVMERPGDVLGIALEHEEMCRVLQMVCIRWS